MTPAEEWGPQMQRCANSECQKRITSPRDAFSYSYYFQLAWCSLKCRRKYEEQD